ncbi:MAG TPA: hemerythrin domain-containing protein [Burkholderiales bacterium]|nr:hemerythrin domain-containing protein [Burkholderiales bacterium]
MGFSLFGKPKEELDAIEMLMEDHARVRELFKSFEELEEGDDPEIVDIITTACLELMVHSKLEEEIFYPAVHDVATEELNKLLAEAEVEHETIDILVEKLATEQLDEEMYKANFTVVHEYVEHHVKEEEDEMFPKIRDLKGLDLDKLGAQMRARQIELVEEIAADPAIATGPTGGKGATLPKRSGSTASTVRH